jgi:3-deoxy-D-manno-octulosonic-acid transferase
MAALAASPLAPWHLAARARRGKEDVQRLGERLGRAGRARPAGRLIWMHGASVGEGLSLAPLATDLMALRPDVTVLITTGTRTSAEVLKTRMPPAAIHQFSPLDTPSAVLRFLRHWQPDVAILVESELWPNLVLRTRESGARLALVSARMSDTSFRNWRRVPRAARAVLEAFDLILPRDEASASHFRELGGLTGALVDMKSGSPPLPVDLVELSRLRAQIGLRPVVLAASTHPGEEEIILEQFSPIGLEDSRPLLILAPRHPDRGADVEALALKAGWNAARRGAGHDLHDAQVYIADTLGELGLWYRLSSIAIIGGSFVNGVGGHNPLEPARLDCPFVSGVHVENWPVYSALEALDATRRLGAEALGDCLKNAVVDHPSFAMMARRARSFVDAQDQEERTVAVQLAAMLPR